MWAKYQIFTALLLCYFMTLCSTIVLPDIIRKLKTDFTVNHKQLPETKSELFLESKLKESAGGIDECIKIPFRLWGELKECVYLKLKDSKNITCAPDVMEICPQQTTSPVPEISTSSTAQTSTPGYSTNRPTTAIKPTTTVTETSTLRPTTAITKPKPKAYSSSTISVSTSTPKTQSFIDFELIIQSRKEGITLITLEADNSTQIDTTEAFSLLSIELDPSIQVWSSIFGWIYTIAWDISFIPQIIHNWRKKNVIGLSFDFLLLNFVGFSCYFVFNVGLLWIPGIQNEYYERFPTSILHVRINDVIFPLYALLCTIIQGFQCLIYQRGKNQRISTTCRIICVLFFITALIFCMVAYFKESIHWLDVVYMLSYVKLTITCIKYAPQLLENFKHKSTEGWNIWQVILDFVGGSFSILQMFILAYDYDDMNSVLKDPTKLGLGLMSIMYNILFFIQHFCVYRNKKIQKHPEKLVDNMFVDILKVKE